MEAPLSNDLGTFESCDSAWRAAVGGVIRQGELVPPITDPTSVSSNFGGDRGGSLELLATKLCILDPNNRWIQSTQRPISRGYCFAQFLWAMRGSSMFAEIAPYNRRGAVFQDASGHLDAAVGQRIRGKDGNADQLSAAIARLRADPSTKRAFVCVSRPDDVLRSTRDFSCTSSLHLLMRGGALHAIGHMRAQSALMVLPYDLFLMTMVHAYCASELGCRLGSYIHLSNSLHIFDDERSLAESVLEEAVPDSLPMPAMPPSPSSVISTVLAREERLRLSATDSSHPREPRGSLPPYWESILQVLADALGPSRRP